MKSAYTFKIGGEAGFGIMTAGLVFSKIASRSGYYVFNYVEYPSLIRGGHNVMQTTFSDKPVYSQYKHTDFLIALNQETVDLHKHELTPGADVLYDHENKINLDGIENINKIEVPMTQILRDINGSLVMRNAVALGATLALLGGDLRYLEELIDEELGHKHEDLRKINYQACEKSYQYVLEHYKDKIKQVLTPKTTPEQEKTKLVLTGNEAVALGAITAGLGFAAIYPMTPTSNILHALAPYQEQYGFIYKQPEDEISAINMAIGASLTGARSMVATSGGGFCLMSEGYGLAGITETPVVIIMGMRGGPATGLPTWNSQSDLRFVLHASQDEFPRIVLAAGDVEEAFTLTTKAFNLAAKYQTPVVVLVDRYLCESFGCVAPFNTNVKIDQGQIVTKEVEDYKRYAVTENGISPRALVGSGNHFILNSDEHDEYGYSSEELDNRNSQMNKRMQKLRTCEIADMELPAVYGPENADLTIVSWGSNKGPIIEAMKQFKNVNYLHITWINPFPSEFILKTLKNSKKVLMIEENFSSQMSGLIREKTGYEINEKFLKYDGRPFYPEEIAEKLRSML